MVTADSIEHTIKTLLPCEWIRVEGDDGHHFSAVIVSDQFEGKSMVQQHQLVYRALGERMREEIHALSMKTYTSAQWATASNAHT
ncbi:MAG: BolA/IbaG family iron-sulfur metabolism protein [Nitrosomonas sp.]|jgi:acid stress-induced BolA-like protein IbaG/YrbA|nr:BolA/IbaG family iron-sulfur metabolism protein [Nitrosomonas sp.]MCC7135521.1 BolA/IbaG family iron-sulfur metabolism protein [Nitrosomonas sp.]